MTDRPQTIFRVIKNPENPFVMMDKRALALPSLSYKAKGILAYLLSRPDNWIINIADVVNHSPDGDYAVRSGIKELITAGYVRRKVERNEKQQIIRWVMEVYEQPIPADEQDENSEPEPDRGNLHLGYPDVGNCDINNKELTKKENMGADAPVRAAAPEPSKPDPGAHLDRIAAFPADCQPGAKLISEIFNLRPPEKPAPGQKRGDFGLWIKGIQELNSIAAEYNTLLETAIRLTWKRWKNSPFTVAHPGALAKTMISILAAQATPQRDYPVPIKSTLENIIKDFQPRS
ncbi:MAG: hypothetical protein CVU44_06005 [Chloroflexi bacterium HGW-Chloroflexi-6]|nr:MAG: hypothetical protein CVU44_06005 [Chloroflexi bacterium HGW-Chloroflexi-6]